MAQVGEQGVEVAAVGGDVAVPVGRAGLAVAEAPQVGHDHLEAGGDERLDDPPPDALGLGPAVDEQEGAGAADPLVHVGLFEATRRRRLHREAAGVDVGVDRAHQARLKVFWIWVMISSGSPGASTIVMSMKTPSTVEATMSTTVMPLPSQLANTCRRPVKTPSV